MGDSVGQWEGDTLVVDVTGFNDETWLEWFVEADLSVSGFGLRRDLAVT